MKYRYFYQTKENENRDGWISAKNRAEAYAALRKQGIRPYRVVGNDPVAWQPWAFGLAVTLLTVALAAVLLFRETSLAEPPLRRGQIEGDAAVIAAGQTNGWTEVFSRTLDRQLARYAQPGWPVARTAVTEAQLAAMEGELAEAALEPQAEDPREVRQVKGIVKTMRGELKDYLAKGGTIADYLEFLDESQREDVAYYEQACDLVRGTPESLREKARINMNVRLRERGLPEIE